MHIYTIKKNGYAIGQAHGKAEAVARIRAEATLGTWRTIKGEDGPRCEDNGNEYTIERE